MAERTSSRDPCRGFVQFARSALANAPDAPSTWAGVPMIVGGASDRTPAQELTVLRISLARVAQALGVDGDGLKPHRLPIGQLEYEGLYSLAVTQARGWNGLCAIMATRATGIRAALSALLEWGRDHTGPTQPDSPHALLVAAQHALHPDQN